MIVMDCVVVVDVDGAVVVIFVGVCVVEYMWRMNAGRGVGARFFNDWIIVAREFRVGIAERTGFTFSSGRDFRF